MLHWKDSSEWHCHAYVWEKLKCSSLDPRIRFNILQAIMECGHKGEINVSVSQAFDSFIPQLYDHYS